jgi:hypothetical protein
MQSWITEELCEVGLGDERLNQRYAVLLERLENQPSLSIPGSCKGWAETQAAYRFLSNPKVSREKILFPHIQATKQRMKSHPVVLCVEDTTFINFEGQRETPGLGPHTSTLEYGYFLHPLLAMTPEKLCLGTLHTHTWIRDNKFGKRYERAKKPIEEKESQRWIDGYRETCNIQKQMKDTRLVYIADRESDIYELFVEGITGEANWLIRAVRDRKTLETNKIREELANETSLGSLTLKLSHRKKRKRREANLKIFAKQLSLLGPNRYRLGRLPNVTVTAILAIEENPPAGEEPIDWLLITDMEVNSLEEALEKLQWYSCRWQIEIFFFTLKSGCQIEKLQLETLGRLESAVALYMIVAWRLLYIKMLHKKLPEISCDFIFEKEEWQVIYFIINKKPPPKTPPLLSEMVNMLAKLGGYLNRKNDSPPGIKTLWRGIQRARDLVSGYMAAKNMPETS